MSAATTFERYLAFGRIAEGAIATWLRRAHGTTVIPAYEKELGEGKGPQVFTPDGELIAPDLLAIRGQDIRWIEAKHKTVFTWHRLTERWCTGIDKHHYNHYQTVAAHLEWPVYLLFLHIHDTPDPRYISGGCPPHCPVGLFGGEIGDLDKCVNHTHANWGKSGMVYWAHQSLRRYATLDELSKHL